ncbi:MAG: hypothetical protein ABIX10_01625 [Acidimicrobiales bacterium]
MAGCLAVLGVPLVVALVHFGRRPWTPVLDLAMTELRVRDVGGRHSPLIGLPGRIGPLEQQGSHPGPLSFYALAPTYRLLGSTAGALQAATVLVHLVAMGVALLIANRRGGQWLVLAMAVLLATLTAGYGGGTLTEPWNPYLPLLWWLVALLAVWSVVCGDVVLLPLAVLAGSFCAQTHVPYLGLTLGIGALAAVSVIWEARRNPNGRRRLAGWTLGAVALGILLWLPPTIDQVRHDPGNYRTLIDHLADPDEEVEGLDAGLEVGLRYFDVSHLIRGDITDPGWLVTSARGNLPSAPRGMALVVVWAVSAVVAARRSNRPLKALHAVVAAGLVLTIVSIGRIFGVVWYYLTLWGWAIGLLAVLATAWTAIDEVAARWAPDRRRLAGRRLSIGMAGLGLIVVARFSVAAWDSPHADATVAEDLAAVVDDTAAGLEAGVGAATGREGRYLVTWSDAYHIGSQGYGLLNELERRGFDVMLEPSRAVPATAHRVGGTDQATARVHLANGAFVEEWRAVPGAVEVATLDSRTDATRAEQSELRDDVIATLLARGLDDLVPEVDDNLFGAAIDRRVPEATQLDMGRMLQIGAPLAIFVVPGDTPEP